MIRIVTRAQSRICLPRVCSSCRTYSTPARAFSHHQAKQEQQQSDFLEQFIRSNKPDARAIEHFKSNEWTRKIVEDLAYEAVPFYPRYMNAATNENRFFADIVNTESTIPHVLAFRLRDFKASESNGHDEDGKGRVPVPAEVLCLMSLGSDLDSHPSIAHGGFQSVLFDEMAWFLILLHANTTAQPGPRDQHFTKSLTTNFSAPVFTPSDVLLTGRLAKREGRKWWTQHELLDGDGKVLTSAESFWITARRS